MSRTSEAVNIGVGVVVTNAEGEYLLSERVAEDRHGFGEWSFPGGKPEPGEHPAFAAARELYEEAGIVPLGMYTFSNWTYDAYLDDEIHFVTLYFGVDECDQEAQDREPHKHGPWGWFSRSELQRMHNDGKLFSGVAGVLSLD